MNRFLKLFVLFSFAKLLFFQENKIQLCRKVIFRYAIFCVVLFWVYV